MCVKIYALFNPSSSCFSPLLPQSQRAQDEAFASDSLPPQHTRQARSAPVLPSGQLANYNQPQDGADARNNLSKLLAQLLSRKGKVEECLKSPSFSHLISLHTSCSRILLFLFSALDHHSCCVLVPPSGISHLPPALRLCPRSWHQLSSLFLPPVPPPALCLVCLVCPQVFFSVRANHCDTVKTNQALPQSFPLNTQKKCKNCTL